MNFKIVGKIEQERTFAAGSKIREIARLRKVYGKGRWRKRKGIAKIQLQDGTIQLRRYTGTRQQASVARNTKLNTLWIKL